MHEQLEGDKGLEARLASMDARIDKGPPGLWKITEQVAAQAEQLATHRWAHAWPHILAWSTHQQVHVTVPRTGKTAHAPPCNH